MATDLTVAAEWLKESDAELLGFSVASLTGDEQITRGWDTEGIPRGKRAICKRFLASYTAEKNSKPTSTVVDPNAGAPGETFDGLWRHISEGFVIYKGKEYLQQVLRKGYATSIDWSEARLVEGKDLRESEGYRTIRWMNCAPESVNTLALSLNAATYTNPIVKSETITGVWNNISVSPSISEDGSGVITLFLALPQFTLTAYRDALTPKATDVTYLFQVPKNLAQALIDSYKVQGATASVSYANASGLVDIVIVGKSATKVSKTDVITAWNCRYKEYTDYYWDLTTAEADAILVTEPPQGWTYTARKSINSTSGLWDVFVEKRQVQYRNYPYQTTREGADFTEETRQQLGVTTQTAATMTSVDGVIKTQRVDVDDDCSENIRTKKKTVTNNEKTSYDNDGLVKRTITDNTAKSSDLTDTEILAIGEAVQKTNVPTGYPNRTRTRKVKEEAQHVSVPEFLVHDAEGKKTYQSAELHDPDPPDVTKHKITGATENTAVDAADEAMVLSHNLDKYLTHNYKKSRTVKTIADFPDQDLSYVLYGEIVTTSVQEWSNRVERNYVSRIYYYQVTDTYNIQYFDNPTAAKNFAYPAVEGTPAPDDPTDHHATGSGIVYEDQSRGSFDKIDEKIWKAIKVTTTHELRKTYHYSEPTS